MIRRLVLLGATGDLAERYLLPALAALHDAGRLPDGFRLVGASREDWDTERFRRDAARDLDRHAAGASGEARQAVVRALEYRRADAADVGDVQRLVGSFDEALALYLALPPQAYEPALAALAGVPLSEGTRVVVEKPFGEDLASARRLNALLARLLPEERVFRMDHFLGLRAVQNVLGLRFANRVLEPVWNRAHVAAVEITWDETLALEGRAGYYDTAGALKDMLQNHLMQVLCLLAMEPPPSVAETDLRDGKLELLRAVRTPSAADAARRSVRARYAAGRIGGRAVPAYADEEGVDPERRTETFAQLTLFVENGRWAGVPFTLRSGKALARDRHEVVVRFHPAEGTAFRGRQPAPNELRLRLEPDAVLLRIDVNAAGEPFDLESVELGLDFSAREVPAYGQLLLDVLRGDPTLFVRGDEAEAAWAIVEPVLRAWREDRVPLLEYAAGSDGPVQARRGDRAAAR